MKWQMPGVCIAFPVYHDVLTLGSLGGFECGQTATSRQPAVLLATGAGGPWLPTSTLWAPLAVQAPEAIL